MTSHAKKLLFLMAEKYDKIQISEFSVNDYIEFNDSVIDELKRAGFVVANDDVIGTIKLTTSGYNEAKK